MHKVDNEKKINKLSPKFLFSNLRGIFLSPGDTFLRIKQKPYWLIPFIAVLLCSSIASYLVFPTQLKISLKKSADHFALAGLGEEMPPERLTAFEEAGAYLAAGTTILKKILLLLLVSCVIFVVGNLISFSYATFEQVFTITCHSCLITSISALILAPAINHFEITDLTSLGPILFDRVDPSSFLQGLLSNSSFEIFTIWTVVVLGIGTAQIYSWSTRKGIVILLALWGIQLLFRTSITVLFA